MREILKDVQCFIEIKVNVLIVLDDKRRRVMKVGVKVSNDFGGDFLFFGEYLVLGAYIKFT